MNRTDPPSSPLPASCSPPLSLTITQVSSRIATPSPSEPHVNCQDRPSRPPRVSRSLSPCSRLPKMGSWPGDPTHHDISNHTPHRPWMPSFASASAGQFPRLLPRGSSQYIEAHLPAAVVTTASTSVAELAHLIRLRRYQEQRQSNARTRFYKSLVSSALSTRLVHCGELAHRTLIECFRSDDKKGFATLYNALQDVHSSCDTTRQYALLESDLELGTSKLTNNGPVYSFSSFMHEIPPSVREEVLEFISDIRTNPDFLASRIASLSSQELASLTSFRQAMDPIDSVMATQGRGRSHSTSQKPHLSITSHPVERLLSFQRHDPLSSLIHTVFANSSGPGSAEDLRRTNVWATTCARLITENRPGSDRFIKSVLDAWASMRPWLGKVNLELYIMQVLQDGQFLLDRPQDQGLKHRGQHDVRTTNNAVATEEFYDKAVKRLFEIVDQAPNAGGFPEGAMEIGDAILRKLEDSKRHHAVAQTFIVSRWFFSTYLPNAVIYPESQGIMMDHHISESARQKILKEIAIRAQKLVLDLTYWKQAAPVSPEITAHVESILFRFGRATSCSRPVLLPSKVTISPRETSEVQPFLVISPANIIAIVNALFPERRPSSGFADTEPPPRKGGLASAASSISGFSLGYPAASTPGDGSSVLSASASSMTSNTTSREPFLDSSSLVGDPYVVLMSSEERLRRDRLAPTEEYGRRMRKTCAEMTRVLGIEAVSGRSHPCAERWAVLFVSDDGKELRTSIRQDFEDDEDDDEAFLDVCNEHEPPAKKMDLQDNYHQLKAAVTKLLEEFEIPRELAPDAEAKAFSNRTSYYRHDARPNTTVGLSDTYTAELSPRDAYQGQGQISSMIARQKSALQRMQRPPQHSFNDERAHTDDSREEKSVLVTMFEAAIHQCIAHSDFVNAQYYHQALQQLRRLSCSSLIRNDHAALLYYFSRGARESIAKSASAIEEFDAWSVWLRHSQERHDVIVGNMMQSSKALRDKMWYTIDVKNSAVYEEARNVALALKIMGQPIRAAEVRHIAAHKPRAFSKSSSNSFLLKTETQVLELMAAPVDYGGLNKLSDEQSDLTVKWLSQHGIENVCRGEERIHRLCLEIDKCVGKLVGNNMLDGPVLWSSELYRMDKEALDRGRKKGDLVLTSVGTLSIAGEEEYETQPGRTALHNLDFAARSSPSNLSSISYRSISRQNFDSGSWGSASTTDLMNPSSYFGVSSPLFSIDTSMTFWSPFQTQSKHSSITRFRSSSGRGTLAFDNSAVVSDDKRRFLQNLKQTLTGMLLSDLGTIVFSRGSETDAWFSSELGEECIQLSGTEGRRGDSTLVPETRIHATEGAPSEHRYSLPDMMSRPERSGPAVIETIVQYGRADTRSTGEQSTSSGNATAQPAGQSAANVAKSLEFPYDRAFKQLLRKFAAYSNPYAKLRALHELEVLVITALSCQTERDSLRRSGEYQPAPNSPVNGTKPELSSHEPALSTAQTYKPEANNIRGGAPSTDEVISFLQSLFRDPSVRPTTLFRDLQYIAAFVPTTILDRTAEGKAFWDTAIAALALKQDVCRVMIEIADDIVALNTQSRGVGVREGQQASSVGAASGTASSSSAATTDKNNDESAAAAAAHPTNTAVPAHKPWLARFTMPDAASMLLLAAKESDPVAERELAIFYLTHPALLPRAMLPLTRPRDVFREELLAKTARDVGVAGGRGARGAGGNAGYGGRGAGVDEEVGGRSDPLTMCVAQHWMECSRRGGDGLAAEYLRARDEMERV